MPELTPLFASRRVLAPGRTLTVTTPAGVTCLYGEITAFGEEPPASLVTIAASTTVTFGPRSEQTQWFLYANGPGIEIVENAAPAAVLQFGNPGDVVQLFGAGAPTSATGANHAAPGSTYTDTVGANLYIQGGTKAAPAWKLVTRAA